MRRIGPLISAYFAQNDLVNAENRCYNLLIICGDWGRLVYIYERPAWPNFTWDQGVIDEILMSVKFQQGHLLGKMETLGFKLQEAAALQTMTANIVKTSEIEGEHLNPDEVRSSIARHLGIDIAGLVPADRHVDGIVEMLLDATHHYGQALTEQRLCQWHASLFPTGLSGMMLVTPGVWRSDSEGPMQVVSGAYGREKVHFQAPPAKRLLVEIKKFLTWFNHTPKEDLLVKAGIAHLWFVTLHPFEDGNGRIARAVADMVLARAENQKNRFYSMSTQIRRERKSYYDLLEKTQKSSLDITPWLSWFLRCLENAIKNSDTILENVLNKAKFWEQHAESIFNQRQVMMLNILFDGFKGKLTSGKWAKMTKCSQDTAARDIQQLVGQGVLVKGPEGGRSTNYVLKDFAINYIG